MSLVPYHPADRTNIDDSARYTTADATNLKHANASPRELILHESITHLVTEVAELRLRCESLESTHECFAARMNELEKAHRGERVRAPLTKANLTGYAPSGSSSYDDIEKERHAVDEQRFNAVGLILEDYNKRLQAQAEQQGKLEAQVTELTAYKKSSESLFKALKTELDDLNIAATTTVPSDNATCKHKGSGDCDTTVTDKRDERERSLEQQLSQQGEEQMKRIEDVQNRVTAFTKLLQDSSDDDSNPINEEALTQSAEQCLAKLERSVLRLKHHHSTAKSKSRQEQLIDDASTKDAVYRMFADLTSIMVPADGETRVCGDFAGTFDELWPLRDRVVGRLAGFEACGAAFEEARRAVRDLY
ncbi:hypothetical protein B0A55_09623 [Friedmanniomyces simplex]|uniref:Uncharacterized protein n=1 Tax=Friedmanniomyces simplex TaxID=329884 RepID=A0A4U0WWF7_9PEZI|nr:hypothetical protein B0A55_09623 [Friedmanniomyces simplex]